MEKIFREIFQMRHLDFLKLHVLGGVNKHVVIWNFGLDTDPIFYFTALLFWK